MLVSQGFGAPLLVHKRKHPLHLSLSELGHIIENGNHRTFSDAKIIILA
jgi:hypothetical protein